MTIRSLVAAMALSTCLVTPALADPKIMVEDAYARTASDSAKSGASFMIIQNMGDSDDRLIAARSDVAARVELHTHKENAEGLMMMLPLEDGIEIPAGGEALLKRGGDHVMMMGLTEGLADGDVFSLTLVFEDAGDITLDVAVDRGRKASHDHGDMKHGGTHDGGHGSGHDHGHDSAHGSDHGSGHDH